MKHASRNSTVIERCEFLSSNAGFWADSEKGAPDRAVSWRSPCWAAGGHEVVVSGLLNKQIAGELGITERQYGQSTVPASAELSDAAVGSSVVQSNRIQIIIGGARLRESRDCHSGSLVYHCALDPDVRGCCNPNRCFTTLSCSRLEDLRVGLAAISDSENPIPRRVSQ
jgi:hypothetical protein